MATALKLERFGWSSFFQDHFTALKQPDWLPARVAVENKHNFLVLTERGEAIAEIPGKMLHQATRPSELPKVGDFVAVEWSQKEARPIIRHVLPRKSQFVRQTGGKRKEEQVLATNIDLLFIIQGLDRDFNPRRLERYVVLAHESGCQPVLLLNKMDLCDDHKKCHEEVVALFPGLPVFTLCARHSRSVSALRKLLKPGITVAVVGSSGSGKSTLVNTLAGEELQDVGEELAWDERGKHTTVRRELLFLPGGAVIIDTPGIREVQLGAFSQGLEAAFPEIDALSLSCRFTDCGHHAEPGCAVRLAIAEERLSLDRLESFHKLHAENKRKQSESNPYTEKRRKEASRKSERQAYQGRHFKT